MEAAPVNDDFFAVPYATTITSSSTSALGDKVIFAFGRIATSIVRIPMYEIRRALAELSASQMADYLPTIDIKGTNLSR
ncbi:MAG: hypothetical protein RR304_08980, partial [Bacteroides sp.]